MIFPSYEMLVGLPPFYHPDEGIMFRWIMELDVRFPDQINISDNAKDLIK
jgi:hypothetical protein